jgi:adenosylcobyric acid synthase
MHGLFQNPGAVNALLAYLSERRGVPFEPVAAADGDAAYDDLARHFEEHVDMDALMVYFQDGKRRPRDERVIG